MENASHGRKVGFNILEQIPFSGAVSTPLLLEALDADREP